MSTTKLIVHHRYRDNVAYDWSKHNNHGHLRFVATGNGNPGSPNVLLFDGGADRVEIAPSDSLRDFGELRIRAVFRPEHRGGAMRRYNLVEGEFAFALFRENDGSLMATIRSPSAGWIGPRSAPGLVTLDRWHVADFVHDGISHGRLYLDGSLVAERWDMNGPIGDLGARGVVIGHWPGDDRYTLVGQLSEVQIWKDDPKRDAEQVIDDCCLDRSWFDDRVADVRRQGWTAAAARDSFAAFFGHTKAAAAEVRDGDAVRAKQIAILTQQTIHAFAARDTGGVEATLGTLSALVDAQLGPTRIAQLGGELLTLLRATPAGAWMGGTDEQTLAFFQELAERGCLGDAVPPHRGDGKDDPKQRPPRRPEGDPDTDHAPPRDPEPAYETVVVPPDAETAGGAGGPSLRLPRPARPGRLSRPTTRRRDP